MAPDATSQAQGSALGQGDVLSVVSTFSGPIAAFVTLVLVLFLRRLLPQDKRSGGKVTLGLLLVSLVLHGAAIATGRMSLATASSTLQFIAIVLQSFAMTGVARMIIFDLALRAVRVRVPNTLQDIIQ